MTESPHLATLRDLNHNYVRSVDQADVRWFDQHLASGFHNTNPDGTSGTGWYTDDWQLRPEGWRCVSAHVSRS